jgi:hypothetical protein
MNLLSFIEKKI